MTVPAQLSRPYSETYAVRRVCHECGHRGFSEERKGNYPAPVKDCPTCGARAYERERRLTSSPP